MVAGGLPRERHFVTHPLRHRRLTDQLQLDKIAVAFDLQHDGVTRRGRGRHRHEEQARQNGGWQEQHNQLAPGFASRATIASSKACVSTERSLPSVGRSEEHTSELQSLMRISYAVFCLNKQKIIKTTANSTT